MKESNSKNSDLLQNSYLLKIENVLSNLDFNKFSYDDLSAELKGKFDDYVKKGIITNSMVETAFVEGYIKGFEISFYEGIERSRVTGITNGVIAARVDMILSLHKDGVGLSSLAKASKLTEEEVLKVLKDHGAE